MFHLFMYLFIFIFYILFIHFAFYFQFNIYFQEIVAMHKISKYSLFFKHNKCSVYQVSE